MWTKERRMKVWREGEGMQSKGGENGGEKKDNEGKKDVGKM